ncbi:hypothetical protein [Mycoplasma crocodyli]|uniref:Uncharacterized protein n=1 Tax=Mycoplasma crocodyli (strain ATCC 51981 / MP145) TaxID=512564 RepID=D5E5Q3_MYCCM|nr:hypothetical protein [Mycoplasma crocodyli]ADE19674.1 hypothetical protein MCRO_0470 [Mycoplasma crocodyli MP145]
MTKIKKQDLIQGNFDLLFTWEFPNQDITPTKINNKTLLKKITNILLENYLKKQNETFRPINKVNSFKAKTTKSKWLEYWMIVEPGYLIIASNYWINSGLKSNKVLRSLQSSNLSLQIPKQGINAISVGICKLDKINQVENEIKNNL